MTCQQVTDTTERADHHRRAHAHEEHGYHQGLRPRQIQMIAIGGAIGTGLFMGAGSRLHDAGPGLFLVYAICGVFVFFILRALGELVLHRPATGSFVSYAREFFGEKTAYVAGWLYWFNWSMTAIVDVTAVALYLHYWSVFDPVPQWLLALIALAVVMLVNLISVSIFGEMEFWASLIKVAALVAFLAVGIALVAGRVHIDGSTPGLSVITDHGGLMPHGAWALAIVTSGVIFAYAAVELVGTAAGETKDPEKQMPRAINSVVLRIAIFYVGSVVLLALLLPYATYKNGESPFVTVFSHLGIAGVDHVMNFVVLTAALSSLNAGLYSTGRILRSMAVNGSAPGFTARMTRSGVPYGGIALTAVITVMGVGLNLVVPEDAFNIALDLSALGIISTWGTILLCHLRLLSWAKQGIIPRPAFRTPGAPWTTYITLAFLAAVLVMLCQQEIWNLIAIVIMAPALTIGWFCVRDRVRALAAERAEALSAEPVVSEPVASA
ncbi:amino acid permease [Nocardioides cheoyonin]|uniref:amino acid permease n=1 Tax=Nocardioides cheoyonin TaxID=3156615 RepID=UPI003CCC49EA